MRLLVRTALVACAATFAVNASAATPPKSNYTSAEFQALVAHGDMSLQLIESDKDTSPVFEGRMKTDFNEYNFWVRTRGCNGTTPACDTFIFFANFKLGRDVTEKDYHVVNKYNDTKEHGRAYILEKNKQIGVDYVLETAGGVTENYVTHSRTRWTEVVQGFVAHVRKSSTKEE